MPSFLQAKERRGLKLRLCEAQNWRCCYCGCVVSVRREDQNKRYYATFEHVVPLSQKAFLEPDRQKARNIKRRSGAKFYHKNDYNYQDCVIACQLCNSLRKNTDVIAFVEGELWKPENRIKLKLWHMMFQAKLNPKNVGILRAMGNFCKCHDYEGIEKLAA